MIIYVLELKEAQTSNDMHVSAETIRAFLQVTLYSLKSCFLEQLTFQRALSFLCVCNIRENAVNCQSDCERMERVKVITTSGCIRKLKIQIEIARSLDRLQWLLLCFV